jgi:hypothetical protein
MGDETPVSGAVGSVLAVVPPPSGPPDPGDRRALSVPTGTVGS